MNSSSSLGVDGFGICVTKLMSSTYDRATCWKVGMSVMLTGNSVELSSLSACDSRMGSSWYRKTAGITKALWFLDSRTCLPRLYICLRESLVAFVRHSLETRSVGKALKAA